MKKGDIVIVPFPYTNLSSTKSRPALIIWDDQKGEDIIALAITSQFTSSGVKIDNKSLKKGQLPIASFVKTTKVVTLNKGIVRKRVAQLNDDILGKILNSFRQQFL